jgi:hypothetical protein
LQGGNIFVNGRLDDVFVYQFKPVVAEAQNVQQLLRGVV